MSAGRFRVPDTIVGGALEVVSLLSSMANPGLGGGGVGCELGLRHGGVVGSSTLRGGGEFLMDSCA